MMFLTDTQISEVRVRNYEEINKLLLHQGEYYLAMYFIVNLFDMKVNFIASRLDYNQQTRKNQIFGCIK